MGLDEMTQLGKAEWKIKKKKKKKGSGATESS